MSEARRLTAGEAILSEAATESAITTRSRDEVLETLVRQYSRLVYRIAYTALRSHSEADDATQETFLRVLRYGRKLEQVENHKTWLARIAWRVAVERSQKRGRYREIPLDDPESPVEQDSGSQVSAEDAVQGGQLSARLQRLISALPEKLRQPLILSALQELSPREVAATLGISEAAVRSRVFRARQILRERLNECVAKA